MWLPKPYNKNKEKILTKQGKSRLLARLFSQREIDPKTVDDFISSEYKGLSHPHALNDVEKGAKLFCKVAKAKGNVAVIGDYDADGVISSVMIKELCNSFGLECSVFLPSRLEHGYGLNDKTIEGFMFKNKMLKKTTIDLLFVLDCGTNSRDEIQLLMDNGVKEVIVIDHHLPGETVAYNASALVSWHLSKDHKEMCACGEVFQFIRGVRWLTKKVNPTEFLTYAAIGTIADVSPIVGNNRIIVKNGLTEYAINHVVASGIKALMRQSKIYSKSITQHDVSFKIAPKINAVGRIFNPDIVYGLLIERDPDIAKNTAEYVVGYNDERKKIQKKIEEEALGMARKQNNKDGILVIGEDWHIGVVGIVASKLVETFNKPAIVVGKLKDRWKGSGRSVKGLNIKEILDVCPELFEVYGGHSGAVGVTLKPEMVDKANKIFDKACSKYYLKHSIEGQDVNHYDAMIDVPLITPETSIVLRNNLYPYCVQHNSEPVFMIPNVTIMDTSIMARDNWQLLSFFIERDGNRCSHPFKFFTKKFGAEVEGIVADVLFSFPQHDNFEATRFSQFELSVTDIVIKDKA